jgi:hypothetical protein
MNKVKLYSINVTVLRMFHSLKKLNNLFYNELFIILYYDRDISLVQAGWMDKLKLLHTYIILY